MLRLVGHFGTAWHNSSEFHGFGTIQNCIKLSQSAQLLHPCWLHIPCEQRSFQYVSFPSYMSNMKLNLPTKAHNFWQMKIRLLKKAGCVVQPLVSHSTSYAFEPRKKANTHEKSHLPNRKVQKSIFPTRKHLSNTKLAPKKASIPKFMHHLFSRTV